MLSGYFVIGGRYYNIVVCHRGDVYTYFVICVCKGMTTDVTGRRTHCRMIFPAFICIGGRGYCTD